MNCPLTLSEESDEANDDYLYHSEAEMSYMSWRGATIYQDFARYHIRDIQAPSVSLAEYSPCLRRQVGLALSIAAPARQPLPIQACKDLGILDTQWAELSALKAESRYLTLLNRGISPHVAYQRAIGHPYFPDRSAQAELLQAMDTTELIRVLEAMEPESRKQLLASLPDETIECLIAQLSDEFQTAVHFLFNSP